MDKELLEIRKKYIALKKHLPISSFVFVLESNDTVILPFYTGSTFRGAFGSALKRITCTLSRINSSSKKSKFKKETTVINFDCKNCMFKSSCPYMKIFETYIDNEETLFKKVHTVPHPYVLEPPFNANLHVYEKGEEVNVGVNLIGQHVDDLPYFIAAFSEFESIGVGKGGGHLSLKSVYYKSDEESEPVLVYDGKKGLLYDPDTRNQNYFNKRKIKRILEEKRLIIRFLTPARVIYNEQLTENLTFFIFTNSIITRIKYLSFFYSQRSNPLQRKENPLNGVFNFRELLEESKKIEIKQDNLYWFDWERYSKRQNRRMTLGGFMGDITFEGDFSNFIPFLLFGEDVHVGKNTAFGLGKYLIE